MESYGIPVEKLKDVPCQAVEVDGHPVLCVGMPNKSTTRMMGDQVALSTGPNNTIRVIFPYPVTGFRCYMSSDPGQESNPPHVVAYGWQLAYDDVAEQEIEFGFGPRSKTYPSTAQHSSGTPDHEEFRFTHVDLQHGTFWYLAYNEAGD